MKNLVVIILAVFISFTGYGQGIADIMKVEPVNITIGEENQKLVDEYQSALDEEKTELDEMLQKHTDKYVEDITDLITNFTDVLAEGKEQLIKNEKSRVLTRSNSMTFRLIKDKKLEIQRFKNKVVSSIRGLPQPINKLKEKELKEIEEEYKEAAHTEFEENKRALKAFKATEHIQKTHISDMPASTTTDEEQ